MKDRDIKQALFRVSTTVRVNMVDVFIYLHENRAVKPIEIVLRMEEGDEKK
jgi:hypothetical protein